jgi:hypothetical protein
MLKHNNEIKQKRDQNINHSILVESSLQKNKQSQSSENVQLARGTTRFSSRTFFYTFCDFFFKVTVDAF